MITSVSSQYQNVNVQKDNNMENFLKMSCKFNVYFQNIDVI